MLTSGVLQQLPRLRKYAFEHFSREAPGVRVVATAMVGIEQAERLEFVYGRVSELVVRLSAPDRLDDCAMRDTAKGQNHRPGWHGVELPCQVRVAGIDLGTDGLVPGRQAFHGIRDPAILELERIVRRRRFRVSRESKLVKRLVQQNAGMVAREGSACAIGAVRGWRPCLHLCRRRRC